MHSNTLIHTGDYDNEYPRTKNRIPDMRFQDFFLHEKKKSPSIIEMILKNNSSKVENSIILNREILLDSFKNYFEPTFEPIPRYKKKEWIYNDEKYIPYFPHPEKKEYKRKSKYEEGTHSVQTANLGRFIDMAIAVISQIWEKEIQLVFGTKYFPPDLEIFNGIVASIRGKNGKIATVLSPIFHLGSTDTIHMSRNILEMIDFYTTPESAIGLTLAIAHEFGHSIQRQLGLMQNHGQAEDMADFVAGYTMKVLGSMGLLGESDVVTALHFFESIGVPEDQRDGSKVHDTPEGRMSHLMRGYMCDTQGLQNEITQYYPILKLNSKVLKILDYN